MISVEVITTVGRFDVFVTLNVTDINGFLNFYIFDRETSLLTLDYGKIFYISFIAFLILKFFCSIVRL